MYFEHLEKVENTSAFTILLLFPDFDDNTVLRTHYFPIFWSHYIYG